MAKKKIIWTETAAKQRRQILHYWVERNGTTKYAEELIRMISAQLKVIVQNPDAFKATEIVNINESAMGHFSLYYKVTDDNIIVMAFWDNRQDPKKLLKVISKK